MTRYGAAPRNVPPNTCRCSVAATQSSRIAASEHRESGAVARERSRASRCRRQQLKQACIIMALARGRWSEAASIAAHATRWRDAASSRRLVGANAPPAPRRCALRASTGSEDVPLVPVDEGRSCATFIRRRRSWLCTTGAPALLRRMNRLNPHQRPWKFQRKGMAVRGGWLPHRAPLSAPGSGCASKTSARASRAPRAGAAAARR
jgi:hypothetical protein